eukprot:7501024-Heterocapsa_arctica.AAC.1
MDKQKQDNEQVHEYAHGGLLHRNAMEEINKNEQAAGEQLQQSIHEGMKDVEEDIDTQEYEL